MMMLKFQVGEVRKHYLAVVRGRLTGNGCVEYALSDKPEGWQFQATSAADIGDFLVARHFNSDVPQNTFSWMAEYVSEATGGGTPAGLKWFKWTSKSGQGIGTLEKTDTSLMCADCTAMIAESKISNFNYCQGSGAECLQNADGRPPTKCQPGCWSLLCNRAPAQGLYDIVFDFDDGTPCRTCPAQTIISSFAGSVNDMGFPVGGCQGLPMTDPLYLQTSGGSGSRPMRFAVGVDRIARRTFSPNAPDNIECRSAACHTQPMARGILHCR